MRAPRVVPVVPPVPPVPLSALARSWSAALASTWSAARVTASDTDCITGRNHSVHAVRNDDWSLPAHASASSADDVVAAERCSSATTPCIVVRSARSAWTSAPWKVSVLMSTRCSEVRTATSPQAQEASVLSRCRSGRRPSGGDGGRRGGGDGARCRPRGPRRRGPRSDPALTPVSAPPTSTGRPASSALGTVHGTAVPCARTWACSALPGAGGASSQTTASSAVTVPTASASAGPTVSVLSADRHLEHVPGLAVAPRGRRAAGPGAGRPCTRTRRRARRPRRRRGRPRRPGRRAIRASRKPRVSPSAMKQMSWLSGLADTDSPRSAASARTSSFEARAEREHRRREPLAARARPGRTTGPSRRRRRGAAAARVAAARRRA